ncbi:MAG: zinc ABC transporter ATP-binding protein AztA [Beijerinckiaceae bacterium]
MTRTLRGPGVDFNDVTLGYDRHPAVHHLRARFTPGSLTAIVGPNGAGKSTLIKGIAGLLKPMTGSITIAPPARMAYMPQTADLDPAFPMTVYDLVSMGVWPRRGMFGGLARADRARIDAAIAAVALEGFENRAVGTLSGGQMQRALFARLSLQDADLILLDEPFAAIDENTVTELLLLMQGWHREGRTVIAVLHDMELVARAFPHTLLLARELVDFGLTPDVLTPVNLTRARSMVEAFDRDAPICARHAA